MNEIFARGPVTCPIVNTVNFENYKGGVYSEYVDSSSEPNHVITIVGWGID